MAGWEVAVVSTARLRAEAPQAPGNSLPSGADGNRWQRISTALAPALVYLTIRQLSLLVLAWMATARGEDFRAALTAWDGLWYLGLAEGGYDGVPAQLADAFGVRDAHTPLAFFPGYPALTAVVAWLPGLPLIDAALTVSAAAGVAASYGLVRLAELVPGGSRRAGLILVALFAAAPMSVVLSMAYTEALFCALAVWCLVALLRRQWLAAGALCALAGLVRPTAAALVAAVVAAAAVAMWQRRDGWRPLLAAVLAPAGLVGYLGFVALRTGRTDGWFSLQERGWGSRFDGGFATLRFVGRSLADAPSVLAVATVWLLTVAVALFLVCLLAWRRGSLWPLLVYLAVVLVMDLGSDGLMNSKARLLVPAFVLLVPAALVLARRPGARVVPGLVAFAAFGAWFGAYALTVWPYAI